MAGAYKISFQNRVGNWAGYSIWLVDRFTSTSVLVDTNTIYLYQQSTDTASFGSNRFYLRLQNLNFVAGVSSEQLQGQSGVTIAPNPLVDGLLHLQSHGLRPVPSELHLTDSKGNICWRSEWQPGQDRPFNLSFLPAGIYYLHVIHPDYKGHLKLVKP